MERLTLEDLKQRLKEQQEKERINSTLTKEEIDFFLLRASVFKILNRVAKYYNEKYNKCIDIKDNDGKLEIKQFLNIELISPINLEKAYKATNIINEILSLDEKEKLKEMYLSHHIKELEQKLANEKNKQKQKEITENNALLRKEIKIEISNFMNELEEFLLNFNKFNDSKKELKLKLEKALQEIKSYKKRKDIKSILANKEIERLLSLRKSLLELAQKGKIKSPVIENIKEQEYQEKLKNFKLNQEQELLKRIEDRKNGMLVGNEKIPSKIDPIIIEAYLEDFNSERSRFVLSVITANNIHLAFYNGVIKLINEDESFDEVYFTTNGNILKFTNEKYSKDILINTLSIEKISDILLKQSNNKIFTDMILNSLSVLHYINTFYNEKEKIEVSYEDIAAIKINKKEEKDINNLQSIVYLTKSKNKQTIQTIKIKKGKRKIDGTFLIRGHWRRQKYLTSSKLIWIEPFWKGVGSEKQRVYKILKEKSYDEYKK